MLLVAATELELEIASGVLDVADTLCCGLGPVEAAASTARRLAGEPPGALLHVGVAGATELDPPALVIGSESIYCDILDATATGARIASIAPDPRLLAAARRALPGASVLPIATSARVGGGTECTVEAMEGFGVLRAAALAGVPAVEVRAISNAVGEQDRGRWQIAEALAALREALPLLVAELSHA